MKKSLSLRYTGALTLVLTPFLGLSLAQAQPDADNAPKADNPTNRPPRADVPPEQRMKDRVRRQIEQMGITEAASQDALISYISDEMTSRGKIMDKGRELQQGLRGDALTDTQVVSLLNDYQAAIEEDKTRRIKAQATLKTAVDITKYPRVEAMLTVMGLFGDGPALMMGGGGGRPGGNGGGNGGGPNNGGGGGNGGGNGGRPRPNRPGNNQPPADAPPADAAPAANPA